MNDRVFVQTTRFIIISSFIFVGCRTPGGGSSEIKGGQYDSFPSATYELYGTIPQGHAISAAFKTSPKDKSKSCRTISAPGGFGSRIAETLTIGAVTTSTVPPGGFLHLSQSDRTDGKADYRVVMDLNNPTTDYRSECKPQILMLRFVFLEQKKTSERKDLFRMFATSIGTKEQPSESGMACRGMECRFYGEDVVRNMDEHGEVYKLVPGRYRFDVDYQPR